MTVTHIFFDVGGVLGTAGWEDGRMTLDEYLGCTVFTQPREFNRAEFTAFMQSQSEPFPETIAIARGLADAGRHFFSSCWLGVTKPSPRIFELALSLSQADPVRSVFIDDREQNLAPARVLGMHTIRFRSAGRLASELGALGIGTRERGRQLCDSR